MKLKKGESVTVGSKTYKDEIPDGIAKSIGIFKEKVKPKKK